MNKNEILAHIGLALVTYIPLIMSTIMVLIAEPVAIAELFTFGSLVYIILATVMLMLAGWWYIYLFIATSLVISTRGLIKRENSLINTVTLVICIAWVTGYWILRFI